MHYLNQYRRVGRSIYLLLSLFALLPTGYAQLSIGTHIGFDQPLFQLPYQELEYGGSRYFDVHADLLFGGRLGLRTEYANLLTRPRVQIPGQVFYGTTAHPTTTSTQNLQRHFVGLGPSYKTYFGNSPFSMQISPLAGRSWLRGGDAYVEANGQTQLVNTGFDDASWAAKLDLDFQYDLSPSFSIGLGLYYLRHFNVHPDEVLDVGTGGTLSISHGELSYDHSVNPYTVSGNPPNVVNIDPDNPVCSDLSSVGASLSLRYRFTKREKEPGSCTSCCPDDDHRVVVTVRDEPTGQVLPSADVAIKDFAGQVIATGTTNSFGVVDFGEIPHGNYLIEGLVYDIATSTGSIQVAEFGPGVVIQKEILYTDLRFILRGTTVNKGTRRPEPDVLVRLMSDQSGAVRQDNTGADGAFSFPLDPNSSYEVVGSKRNRLSDIERASTIGLTRSTTLFVELELGVDDFNCGQGAVLDIKYDLDDYRILPEARFELDRLVRYLNDNLMDRVELGSHTDSRGSTNYNQTLSENRALSAVDYIISKGISRDRILAKGYGETRLLNACRDGVTCSEEDHRINRRTEAVLLCN